MYNWRKLSNNQKKDVLDYRQRQNLPWHSPPHRQGNGVQFHVTAACYEHKPVIGASSERMITFESHLLEIVHEHSQKLFAWAILPNHYHLLIECDDVISLLKRLGTLHGRSSFAWNGEDNCRGRRAWCNALEHAIKSTGHFYATLNYVHHNPVKHGYVSTWQEWPYSSAADYLEQVGRDKVLSDWQKYDISTMGKWDHD